MEEEFAEEENVQEILYKEKFEIVLVTKNYLIVKDENGFNSRIPLPVLENIIFKIGDILYKEKGEFQLWKTGD